MVVAVGVAVGGVTLNLIILVSISVVGLTLATYIDKSNLQKDIEKCKLAYISHKKVLTEIRDYLRGSLNNETRFLSNITINKPG